MKITASILIRRSAEFLFDYTQDYSNRLTWDTFLSEAILLDATHAATGVKAWCVSRRGMGMETVYVTYNRPKVTAIRMTERGPRMFRSFAGSWRFELVEGAQTQVTFTYHFKLRFPWNMTAPLIRGILLRNMQRRLIDLKNCTEAGAL